MVIKSTDAILADIDATLDQLIETGEERLLDRLLELEADLRKPKNRPKKASLTLRRNRLVKLSKIS